MPKGTLNQVMAEGNGKSTTGPATARKPGKRGRKSKVPDEQIIELLRQGLSQAEIARQVGLSDQAISKRVKRLGHRAVAALFHADSQLWGVELKTMAQLAELNSRLMHIATKRDASVEATVAAAREIRQQLDFQARFQEALKVQQRFEEFRETVLRVLDEVRGEIGIDLRSRVMAQFKVRTQSRLMLSRPRLKDGRGKKRTFIDDPRGPDDPAVALAVESPVDASFSVVEPDNDQEEENEGAPLGDGEIEGL